MARTVRPGRDDVVDAILAVVLGAVSVASVLTPATGTAYQFRAPDAGVAVLALAAALPFAGRRRRPLTVGLAVSAATVTIAALRWNAGIGPFLVLFALYTTGYGREMRAALAGLAFTYAGLGLLLVLRVPYFEDPAGAAFFGFATAAWGFGRWMRGRRTERERAVARAVAAERSRAIEAERAVLAERLHIARELHDVVSHTLTVIAVQAGTARLRLARGDEGSDGGSAVPALTAIETTAREALADLRRMLGPLRTTLADAVPDPGPLPEVPARGPVREGLVDAVLAAVLAALGIAWAFVRDPSRSYAYPRPDALLVALIAVACLSLAVRRRWPLSVLAACVTAMTVTNQMGWNADWPGFAAYVALYTVAVWRTWPVAAAGLRSRRPASSCCGPLRHRTPARSAISPARWWRG